MQQWKTRKAIFGFVCKFGGGRNKEETAKEQVKSYIKHISFDRDFIRERARSCLNSNILWINMPMACTRENGEEGQEEPPSRMRSRIRPLRS